MLTIGITEDQFWNGNPRLLKPYKKAYDITAERRAKETDYTAWLFGLYNLRAVEVPIEHFAMGLSRKRSEAKYHDKPISQQPQNGDVEELSEDQKLERVRMLFAALEIRKTNFELSKKGVESE